MAVAELWDAARWLTWWVALLPLATWAGLHRPGPAIRWLAFAFAVSWVADLSTRLGADPWVVGYVYPVAQYGILFAVLTYREQALTLCVAVAGLSLLSLLEGRGEGPELIVRTFGAAVIVRLAFPRWEWGRMRIALLVYFGLGAVAWVLFGLAQTGDTWLVYQGCRVIGLLLMAEAFTRERRLVLVHGYGSET